MMEFDRDGARLFRSAALAALSEIRACLPDPGRPTPGIRIADAERLRPLVSPSGVLGSVAAAALGPSCRPVRAVLFNKAEGVNWSLGWHQDRTIAVTHRVDVEGFGPWSVKQGIQHVAPPFALIEAMVTIRVHLDDVPAENAPLLIAPGSHRLGLVPVADVAQAAKRFGTVACLAEAGDVWLYATPILHASETARHPLRRRVLQLDYSTEELPGGLAWLGV